MDRGEQVGVASKKNPGKFPEFKRCLCRSAAPANSHLTLPVGRVGQPI